MKWFVLLLISSGYDNSSFLDTVISITITVLGYMINGFV